MPKPPDEARHLLFGLVALQNGMISQAQLVAAFQAWTLGEKRSMAQILGEQGALAEPRRVLLEAIVAEHLALHGDDPERSLAALEIAEETRLKLAACDDSELTRTIAHVRLGTADPEGEGEEDRTPIHSVGGASVLGRRFRVLRPHAKGGLGAVFVALDTELNREVALKEILPGQSDDPSSRSRFLLEAEVTGRLEHPGVVPVYGLGTDPDGRPFYAMRLIRGETLKQAVDRHHQSPDSCGDDPGQRSMALRDLLTRLVGVCNAIEYAHSRGVIHRDIKPANILLGPYGETLVVDWGLAKVVGRDEEVGNASAEPTIRPATASGSSETQAGTALGTPAYMSPEQAEGRLDLIGPASDVYSLGGTLYFTLTAKTPFEGRNLIDTLSAVRAGEFPAPRKVRRGVHPALDAICMKAMALKPIHRYGSAQALAEDIKHWLAGEPVVAYRETALERLGRRVRRNPGATALVLALGLVSVVGSLGVAWQWQRSEEQRRHGERVEQGLYFNRILLAEREWTEGNIGRVEELLKLCEPASRGWEWRYLDRLRHSEVQSWPVSKQYGMGVAFSPDGNWMAVCSHNFVGDRGSVQLFNMKTRREEGAGLEHASHVIAMAFSPNGERIATATGDMNNNYKPGAVKIWDVATRAEIKSLPHAGTVLCLGFSPDGKRIASGGGVTEKSGEVKVWDIESGKVVHVLGKEHKEIVHAVGFSPDGKRLASADGSADHLQIHKGGGELILWDAETGSHRRTLTGHTRGIVALAFSPDSSRIVTGSWDNTAKVWNLASGRPGAELTLRGHGYLVTSVDFDRDGRRIASAAEDGTVRIWDASDGSEQVVLRGHTAAVVGVKFHPGGRLVGSASADRTARLWDTEHDAGGHVLKTGGWPSGVAFSAKGDCLAAAVVGGPVRLYDPLTYREICKISALPDPAWCVAFSPDGTKVALACGDSNKPGRPGLVTVHNASTGEILLTLKGHTGCVQGVAFNHDGTRIASASWDNTVKLWDAATGEVIYTFEGHTATVWSVAFSRDGTRIVSGSWDKTVRVWDATSFLPIHTLSGHTDMICGVAVSPDGSRIASASGDRTVRVWDMATGELLRQLRGHSNYVFAVAFSPDGKRMATSSLDQTVKLWDAGTGQQVLTLRGHVETVFGVAFSPDQGRIASASSDGTVRVWVASEGRNGE